MPILEKWSKIEGRIAAFFLALSVTLAFYEVISRYLIHTSLDWAAEIVLVSISWSTIFGASKLIKEDKHVNVSVILDLFAEEKRDTLIFLNALLCLVFTVVLLYSGITHVIDSHAKGIFSESTLKMPLWIYFLCMPIGGLLFSIHLVERLVGLWRKTSLKRILTSPFLYVYIAYCIVLYFFWNNDFSPTMVLIVSLAFLLILGMPIAFAMGLASLCVFYFWDMLPLVGMSPKMYASITNFSYLAIPYFVLSGAYMTGGGIAEPLLRFADEMLKWTKGGFAIAVMFSCMIFAALSGASAAIAAALGIMAMPAMIEKGYPKHFNLGILAAGGTLGVMIPPSTILILYGAVSGESIADLFKAGILPGIILGIIMCFQVYVTSKIKGYGLAEGRISFNFRRLGNSAYEAKWAIMMPVIILGGIYSGIFTPTEAAAVAVFYALIVCSFTYKRLKFKDVLNVLADSAKFNSMIYFIIMTSTLFSFLITMEQFSNQLLAFLIGMNIKPWVFILLVNVAVFIMGCFMGPGAIMLMVVPILHPMLPKLGIHPIHFGILLTLNMELAFISPPFGMNLFVLSGVCKAPVAEVVKGTLPFIILLLAALIVISYVPAVSLVLL